MKLAAILCDVDGCKKPRKDKAAFCSMHRSRIMRYGGYDLPIIITQKTCQHCSAVFETTQRNNRAKFCPDCRATKWKIYPVSTWERSEKGKAYYKKYNAEYKAKLRAIVFDVYGALCSCCGETGQPFLSIDHVNNDGHLDRKAGITGIRLYQKIIKSNFSEDYQVLCMNCNFAKKNYGGVCPHQA